MKTLEGFWFGVFVAPFFALASFLFFYLYLAPAVTDTVFWLMLLSIGGCVILISTMRDPLRKLNRAPRAVAWFSIGVTVTAFIAIGASHEFSLATAMGFGLALSVFDFIVASHFQKKDAENG